VLICAILIATKKHFILIDMNRHQSQILAGILFTIGVILLLVTAAWMFFGNRFSRYKNTVDGYSISYPSRWLVKENFNGASVVFLAPREGPLDYFSESVSVVVQDLSAQPISLVDYTQLATHQMKVVFKQMIDVIESGPTTISGLPAHRYIFIGKGVDGDMKYHMVWLIKGFKAYQVTFTSVASQYGFYEKDLSRMLGSFRAL
jgi:hypothetical protein